MRRAGQANRRRLNRRRGRALSASTIGHPAAQRPLQDQQQDEDDSPTYIFDEYQRLVLAEWTEDGYLVPAQPIVDHAAELVTRGYIIDSSTPVGTCPIVNTRDVDLGRCAGAAFREYGSHRVCEKHHRALMTPLAIGPAPRK